jgi:hypothetical protein
MLTFFFLCSIPTLAAIFIDFGPKVEAAPVARTHRSLASRQRAARMARM